MNNKELEQVAHELISGKINRKEEVQMPWAVQEIINGAGAISGDGVPFYTLCANQHVWRVVKRVVDKYDQGQPDEDSNQLLLEGFEYLHAAYTILRESERVLVPVELISNQELLARADEYDSQADGLRAHAQEIRRYVAQRDSEPSALPAV